VEYPEFLQPVLSRITGGFPKTIDCGKGWWPIIADLDIELSEIDPDYSVYQVKEKFGNLRYYYAPSFPEFAKQMNDLVSVYEFKCALTCEATGNRGVLMIRNGLYKTLNESFAGQNGWEIAESL
jgi:hypothetical protein